MICSMKTKFFICTNKLITEYPKFTSTLDFKDRTIQQLNNHLVILEAIVKEAATSARDDVIPVVFCNEDFFQGEKISAPDEVVARIGECLDRDIAYNFMAKELVELSKKYPQVLIIPGSMYVSVHALPEDASRYKQDTINIMRSNLYVQNIAPIYYDGHMLRIIKKGDFLFDKKTRRKITSSEEHYTAIDAEHNFTVPKYREDTLEELNPGLVFLGKTPLPGEEALIDKLGLGHLHLFSPTFEINKLTFGLEICSDHNEKDLPDDINIHLVSSNGVAWTYNACNLNGYRVQSDAESENLCSVSTTLHDYITLDRMEKSEFSYFASPVLAPLQAHRISKTIALTDSDSISCRCVGSLL